MSTGETPQSPTVTGKTNSTSTTRSTRSTSGTGHGTPIIEADSVHASDTEEVLDDRGTTQSVTDSVFEFQRENGRTYHGYKAGVYHFPNDTSEQDRLDFQFWLLHDVFEKKYHFAPLTDPKNILDIGTGTGVWAIEMGDLFPNCKIEATDLSPIQPSSVPVNVEFLIDDAEQEDWGVPANHYDYIHTRAMLGCFRDFKEVIKQGFVHTKPGGWMESQELHFTPYCDDGTMPPDWPLVDWSNKMHEASMEADRPIRIGNKLKGWYTAAGFVDVHERVYKLPVGTWPRDLQMKRRGRWWRVNISEGLQAFSSRYFTRFLEWTPTEMEVYLANLRNSLRNQSRVHCYHRVYVVWGRKPDTAV